MTVLRLIVQGFKVLSVFLVTVAVSTIVMALVIAGSVVLVFGLIAMVMLGTMV